MIKSLISLALLLISAFLSFKHGWDGLNYRNNPGAEKMMGELGIEASFAPVVGAVTIAIGLLILIPRTFFVGNLLNAITILVIMALALRVGNVKMALIEIPFLIMPLLLIWLKYPFKG